MRLKKVGKCTKKAPRNRFATHWFQKNAIIRTYDRHFVIEAVRGGVTRRRSMGDMCLDNLILQVGKCRKLLLYCVSPCREILLCVQRNVSILMYIPVL